MKLNYFPETDSLASSKMDLKRLVLSKLPGKVETAVA
jgi:hypothetical protein